VRYGADRLACRRALPRERFSPLALACRSGMSALTESLGDKTVISRRIAEHSRFMSTCPSEVRIHAVTTLAMAKFTDAT
jgi:hypothetical protein